MSVPTVPAGWPPVPGLDKEEPRLWLEDDIPQDDTVAEREARASGVSQQRSGTPSAQRGSSREQPPAEADAQRTP